MQRPALNQQNVNRKFKIHKVKELKGLFFVQAAFIHTKMKLIKTSHKPQAVPSRGKIASILNAIHLIHTYSCTIHIERGERNILPWSYMFDINMNT